MKIRLVGPNSTTSPRYMKAACCEMRAACCMLCVTITMVKSRFSSSTSSSILPVEMGSRAEVGSSRRMTSGRWAIARAMHRRCCCPPEMPVPECFSLSFTSSHRPPAAARPATAALVIAPFLAIDLVFLFANMLKIVGGGWMPLAVGASLMVVMLTWRRGTRILSEKAARDEVRLAEFIAMLDRSSPDRVQGIAVFLTGQPDSTPSALLHNLKHNKVLHQHNVIVSVIAADTPRVDDQNRILVERVSDAFW